MIRYLTLEEVLELHRLALEQSGGMEGVRDIGSLDSALAQPQMAFGGHELYPTLGDKAAALGFSLVCNHPFLDGISASATRRWRRFWYLTDGSWRQMLTSKSELSWNWRQALKREGFAVWVRSHLHEHRAESL